MVFFGSVAWGAENPTSNKSTRDPSKLSPAERLVREALAAEIAGDNARRTSLLAEALRHNPDCHSARWQSGYVELSNRWFTPDEVAAKAAKDAKLAEYRRRRDEARAAGLFSRGPTFAAATLETPEQWKGASLGVSKTSYRSSALSAEGIAAHAELARWCLKNNLLDEERAHWTQVLLNDPDNHEAQTRLHMRSFLGRLLTETQIEAARQQRVAEEKELKHWGPIALRWQKALDQGSPSEQNRATSEMASATDQAIIPALERLVDSISPKSLAKNDTSTPFQREAIALLGRLPQQRATYSLTLQSVLARQGEVRFAAIAELKKRPLHDFVPVLLDQLANPIEFSYVASYEPGTGFASYQGIARQEGPESVRQIEESAVVSGLSPVTVVITGLLRARTRHTPVGVSVVPKTAVDFGPIPAKLSLSASFAASVEQKNTQIGLMNDRISAVLREVTKQARPQQSDDDSDVIPDEATTTPIDSTAEYWWSWWANYNEAYRNPNKPLESVQLGTVKSIPDTTLFMSCFPAGTPVITQLGPMSIEKIQIGDRVLAQNPDTGELNFRPVLGTTVRPPVEMLTVATSVGSLRMTRGHPLWIVGKGWRMAKEIEPGDRVHTFHGAETVLSTKPADAAAAYNLLVADDGTYFVGRAAMLVHDNSPRLPTQDRVPGFADAR
jgi:hypothetical protein